MTGIFWVEKQKMQGNIEIEMEMIICFICKGIVLAFVLNMLLA